MKISRRLAGWQASIGAIVSRSSRRMILNLCDVNEGKNMLEEI